MVQNILFTLLFLYWIGLLIWFIYSLGKDDGKLAEMKERLKQQMDAAKKGNDESKK